MRSGLNRALRGDSVQIAPSRQPWLIFTAGCMGAGKTHTMCRLDSDGLIPLQQIVRIDMDRIVRYLPEVRGYMARDPQSTGSMTLGEAGMVRWWEELSSSQAIQDMPSRHLFHTWRLANPAG